MKRLTFFLTALVLCLLSTQAGFAKKIKLTVSPEDASIYVDNNFVGKGAYTANFSKRDGHIRVKFEKEGYVTRRMKILATDKRNSVDVELEKDDAYDASSTSQLANKFFSIPVSHKYVEKAGSTDAAAKLAWKQLHQILMNYIEEIEESNMLGGYIQSAWVTKKFYNSSLNDIDGGVQWRTRVTIKESNDGENLVYKVKVTSEVAPLNTTVEEYFTPINRVLKSFEPMISEFQARLSDF